MSALDSQELTVEDAKRQRVRASGLLLKFAGIAALLAIWQAGVTFLDVPTYILPTPMQVWAALKSLGRSGLADLVDRCCRHAGRFAEGLRSAGFEVLNDVVLNQVVVAFGDADTTRRIIAAVQEDGTCWCGATEWKGRVAMRISVSSWATTAEDVEESLDAIVRVGQASRPVQRAWVRQKRGRS